MTAEKEGPNSPESRVIVACAAEDDQLLLTHAILIKNGQEWSILWAESPTIIEHDADTIKRRHYHPETGEDALVKHISEYVQNLEFAVSAIAVSRGGTVNLDTRIILDKVINEKGKVESESIDLPNRLSRILEIDQKAVIVDNDATAAAMGEACFGTGSTGNQAFAFIWAGKGTNVGLVLKEDVWEGSLHPEAGHCLPRLHEDDTEKGDCLVHGDCTIGMISIPTIIDRLKTMDPIVVTKIIAFYYAQICINLVCFIAPREIVIGGALLRRQILPGLFDEIKSQFAKKIEDYPDYGKKGNVDAFIKEGKLGAGASLWGMVEIARRNMKNLERTDASSIALRPIR